MKRKLRIVNILIWFAVWMGAVEFTDEWGHGVVMVLEGLIPFMMGMFIHIALRPHPEDSVP